MRDLLLIVLLLTGCSGASSPAAPPLGCRVMTAEVRVELCPRWPQGLICQDEETGNPSPGLCTGPDWTNGHQVTGNAWCCNADLPPDWSSVPHPE